MIKKVKKFFQGMYDLMWETRSVTYELRNRLDQIDDHLRDQDVMIEDLLRLNLKQVKLADPFTLTTDHSVAIYSDDHLQPLGTALDNTRSPRFVHACERLFGEKINALDLGCAGGGLVWDFLQRGHRAMGLEGSDFSHLSQRAMWRVLPDYLKTCDITKPYQIDDKFHVISAWEVMEHIPEPLLAGMLDNIKNHLRDDGVFVCSIATFECKDEVTGAVWHVTVKPRDWWVKTFAAHGLETIALPPFAVSDHVRGSGNGRHDWNVATDPHMGFHLTLRKARS